MRTPQYSVETLQRFFGEHIIGTMQELKEALGTSVDMTVYRKLRQLSYLTSYSHQGKFYTLEELADFDSSGLWRFDVARFSKQGTLLQTAQSLIDKSENGYSVAELRSLVGVDVKETLLQLQRQYRIYREQIAGRYVYFSSDSNRRRQQHLLRLNEKPPLGASGRQDALAHEIRAAIILFFSLLDERQRRLYAGLESLRQGRGGDRIISRLLHIDNHTVARGRRELFERDQQIGRIRKKGAGRRPTKKTPRIIERIRSLMKYETAGDPMTGLLWTRKATRKIAAQLQRDGILVSDKTVARLLDELGYSLQANRKRIALSGQGSREQRTERDLQFRRICRMRERFARTQCPVISVDTKKKELIGNFKNAGRVWRDRPCDVADHDFPSYAKGKIIPYGIYDTLANQGSIYLGLSHDTAAFAVDSICSWWEQHGSVRYPHARQLLVLADNGGSNSPSSAAWRYRLWQALCQRFRLKVSVCHYPTGASKWNPIEHRLFSEISKNWAAVPLNNLETAIKYIRKTKTKTGLKVTATLNRNHYPLKEHIAEHLQDQVLITRDQQFPKLNYTLRPQN